MIIDFPCSTFLKLQPWISEINTAGAIRVDVVDICIKNTALHLRRIFQNEKNRARITPGNNTTIQLSDKIQPKPDPPYAVACRFAASLGHDLTQTIDQEEYEERWLMYFGEGLQLKSDSQKYREENAERLARLMESWNALGGDEIYEAHREEWEAIDSSLQYDSATEGNEHEQCSINALAHARLADLEMLGIPQVFHGSVPTSHGSTIAPPFHGSLPVASGSTSPRTPSSLLSAPCSSPPGPHSRFLSPSLLDDRVNPEAQPDSGSKRKRSLSDSEDGVKRLRAEE